MENASGRENVLWYNRRLRELGEEYYEEVRRIRVELENHSAVHRRRCRALIVIYLHNVPSQPGHPWGVMPVV